MPQEATGKTGVPSEVRQKPERPRDELGRPLPWGEATRLSLPDFDAMSLAENDRAGRRFLADHNFFGAHEAWETAWKQAKGTGEEELFKGLSQMGAGYVHLLRGNAHGAITLLTARCLAHRDLPGRHARYRHGRGCRASGGRCDGGRRRVLDPGAGRCGRSARRVALSR